MPFAPATDQSEIAIQELGFLTPATTDVASHQLQFDVHSGLGVQVAQIAEQLAFPENVRQLSQLVAYETHSKVAA